MHIILVICLVSLLVAFSHMFNNVKHPQSQQIQLRPFTMDLNNKTWYKIQIKNSTHDFSILCLACHKARGFLIISIIVFLMNKLEHCYCHVHFHVKGNEIGKIWQFGHKEQFVPLFSFASLFSLFFIPFYQIMSISFVIDSCSDKEFTPCLCIYYIS